MIRNFSLTIAEHIYARFKKSVGATIIFQTKQTQGYPFTNNDATKVFPQQDLYLKMGLEL